MTVGYVGATESVRTGTTSPYTFSHTVGSTAKGLLLFALHATSSTDHAPATAAVTVGGKRMGKVVSAADTAGEAGRVDIWWLGHDLPAAGSQTVSAAYGTTTNDIQFVMVELTGSTDLELVAIATQTGDAANPSQTLNVNSRTSLCIGAIHSGQDAPGSLTPNGNMTAIHDHDVGSQSLRVDRQTTPSSSDFTFSYTATSEDVAMAVVAISEERASPLRDAILALSPAAYWRLGEPTGCLTAFDRGPNLLHGPFTSTPTLAVTGNLYGDADTAATFGGNTQDAEVPDNAAIDNGDTVSVHFLTRSTSGTDRAVIWRGGSSWGIVRDGSTTGEVSMQKVGSTTMMHTTTAVPNDGTWRQVVFTKNGSTRAAYMQGADVTGLDTNQTLVDGTSVLNIGGENTASGYAGSLDEVAIFPTALTAAQVRALYLAATPSAIPTTAALTLTTFAPTVSVESAGQTVTPSTASLSMTAFAPTVTASDHKTVTPTTASLSLSGFAPVLRTGVTPTTAALTLTAFAPAVTATANQTVTPTTAALTLTTFVPVVAVGVRAVPTTASLTLTSFAPTVTISDHKTITPSTASLSMTAFAPTVTASDHKSVTPTTASLSMTAFAPSVVITDHKVATPTTATLTLTAFAPDVSVTEDVVVTPTTASLALTAFAPTVTIIEPFVTGPVGSVGGQQELGSTTVRGVGSGIAHQQPTGAVGTRSGLGSGHAGSST